MASVDTPDDQLISVSYGDIETDDWAGKHQISLAEHASRLDSKHHFDNRGRVIWTNGFENLLVKWTTATAGGGAVARSVLAAWRGNASMRLSHAGALFDMAQISKYFYSPLTGRYGLELAWSCDNANVTLFEVYIDVHDGANRNRGLIAYVNPPGQWQYMNAAGAMVNTGVVPVLLADIHYWHKLKVVIDSNTLEYVRFLSDGVETNMAGIGLNAAAMAGGPYIHITMVLTCVGGGATNLHLDDIILTHLEP